MADRWRNPWPRALPNWWRVVMEVGATAGEFVIREANRYWRDDPGPYALRVRAGSRHACARLRVQLAERKLLVRQLEYERHMGAWEFGNLSSARSELARASRVLEKMEGRDG